MPMLKVMDGIAKEDPTISTISYLLTNFPFNKEFLPEKEYNIAGQRVNCPSSFSRIKLNLEDLFPDKGSSPRNRIELPHAAEDEKALEKKLLHLLLTNFPNENYFKMDEEYLVIDEEQKIYAINLQQNLRRNAEENTIEILVDEKPSSLVRFSIKKNESSEYKRENYTYNIDLTKRPSGVERSLIRDLIDQNRKETGFIADKVYTIFMESSVESEPNKKIPIKVKFNRTFLLNTPDPSIQNEEANGNMLYASEQQANSLQKEKKRKTKRRSHSPTNKSKSHAKANSLELRLSESENLSKPYYYILSETPFAQSKSKLFNTIGMIDKESLTWKTYPESQSKVIYKLSIEKEYLATELNNCISMELSDTRQALHQIDDYYYIQLDKKPGINLSVYCKENFPLEENIDENDQLPLPIAEIEKILPAIMQTYINYIDKAVHFDIKTDNFMYDGENAALIDLEDVKFLKKGAVHIPENEIIYGTKPYVAPEANRDSEAIIITNAFDMHAFGFIIDEVVFNSDIKGKDSDTLPSAMERWTNNKYIQSLPSYDKDSYLAYAKLSDELRDKNPQKRPELDVVIKTLDRIKTVRKHNRDNQLEKIQQFQNDHAEVLNSDNTLIEKTIMVFKLFLPKLTANKLSKSKDKSKSTGIRLFCKNNKHNHRNMINEKKFTLSHEVINNLEHVLNNLNPNSPDYYHEILEKINTLIAEFNYPWFKDAYDFMYNYLIEQKEGISAALNGNSDIKLEKTEIPQPETPPAWIPAVIKRKMS